MMSFSSQSATRTSQKEFHIAWTPQICEGLLDLRVFFYEQLLTAGVPLVFPGCHFVLAPTTPRISSKGASGVDGEDARDATTFAGESGRPHMVGVLSPVRRDTPKHPNTVFFGLIRRRKRRKARR